MMNLSLHRFQLNTRQLVTSRITWIKFNRIVAWALVLAPLVDLILHIKFQDGLIFETGLLVLHGALSLYFFGVPKVRGEKFSVEMHVFGFRPRSLSPRHRFLLTGYRIALGRLAILLYFIPGGWHVAILLLYPTLRMLISTCQHVFSAFEYALMRWHLSKDHATWMLASYIVLGFLQLVRS